MSLPRIDTRRRRTRIRSGRPRAAGSFVAVLAALALGAAAAPATAVPEPAPSDGSHWGDHGRAAMPPVRAGTTRPPRTAPSAAPSAGERAWRQRESDRLRHGGRRSAAPSSLAAAAGFVPRGQGEVPWHRVFGFRMTDALTGRIDYSTGNLMLAATDFDVAGVGQKLQLNRTFNAFTAPEGQASRPWWLNWERNLDVSGANSVIAYDDTGATLEFTRNADGTFTTPTGWSKDLRKNADGTYTLTDRGSGTAAVYDANGRLTKTTDRNGGVLTVTAHLDPQSGASAGFKLTETRSGRWIDLTRANSTRWSAKDNTGRTVTYDLSADHGDILRTTDTTGHTTAYAYDGDGRVTKVTSSEGRSTAFTYDSADRVTSMRRYAENGDGGSGPTYTYAYSAAGAAEQGTTTVTDPLGHRTTYEHNADGEMVKVTDALGHARSSTYQNHLLQTATDAMGTGSGGSGGNVTAYGWDTRNNPTSAKLPTGATSTGQWQTVAGAERPSSSTGADGEKSSYTYDAAGNTASVATTGTGGGTRTFAYNEATPHCGGFQGQICTATDANGKKTEFHYDAAGNLDTATPPAPLGRTTYTYDALGRTATATDGRGVKVSYTYDRRDRVTTVATTGSADVTYTYDGDGNLTTRTDATGTQRYQFDALSRETIRTLQDGSQTVLAYTADGNVDTYRDPGGTTTYQWDAADRLTQLTGPQGKKTTYTYDNNDRRTRTSYPGGTAQTQTLDASGRPTDIRVITPSGIISDHLAYTYVYAAGGQTKDGTKVRTRTDTLTRTRTDYSYDGAGRLSLAKETDPQGRETSWQYCFDAAGNLTSQGDRIGCPAPTAYTYNDASQLTARNGVTTGWSYDKAGNETAGAPTEQAARSAEQYTDYGQLKSLTTGGTSYAAQYASTDSSERTRLGDTVFHNGPLGLSGQTRAGKDTEFVREPGGTLNSASTGGASYYYLTDALGSVIGLVDESGKRSNTYAYTPTGLPRAGTTETVPQPYRFAGGQQDPTGLYHLGNRYYDPQLARFTQPDPSGQEKNPYLYAEGDPVNRIDPGGLLSGTANGEACFYVCLGVGGTVNSDGSFHLNLSAGFGSPGVSGGVEVGSGSASKGFSVPTTCSAGPVSGTVDLRSGQGSASVSPKWSSPKCSVRASYTF
ncbi:RHS repeat-associated protein [Streptomyces sp. BK208]|uniref:RHS repeat-associated core domain-containing protein n=1 Tax=Streptomyces sp. BK208 TaxID=2512150 RepID=UPI0010D4B392|nr:RHS repeat-associated core domain-containing protein [Streptomyces sp. BK208]TDT42046.1 RHS repeat-associated protein [Streptomyces sp. BK208]